MSKQQLVAAFSPKREGYKGVWAGGVFWPEGTSQQLVDEDKIDRLFEKEKASLIKVLGIGEAQVEKALEREAEVEEQRQEVERERERIRAENHVRPPAGVGPRTPRETKPRGENTGGKRKVQLPTFEEFAATGATKGLDEKQAKDKYEFELEVMRDEAKKHNAEVVEPKAK